MDSICPKCHKEVEEGMVCCAGVEYSWKCKVCGKFTMGLVIPYGRCFLCGGENEISKGYAGALPEQIDIVQEAFQYEIDMYQFYRLAMERTTDESLRIVLEELSLKEEDHLMELEDKYHVHLSADLRMLPKNAEQIVSAWIFQGIDFADPREHVLGIYDKAIAMERRTRDRFMEHADALPPGPRKEIHRELAAEEADHVAILETEREKFFT